ncbi:MAG: S8 family serine peptidase [Candidatus Limnocylindria bacterium]
MRSQLARALVAAFVIGITSVPSQAATASISIDSVGGRRIVNGAVAGTLFGKTLVEGTAVAAGIAPVEQPAAKPLVADAGDSAYVETGRRATLLGSGYGGAEPYTFSWTSAVGTVDGADAPTAQLDTTDVAPGTYDVTLTITDSAGATATDSVRVRVFAVSTTVEEQVALDLEPGTFLSPSWIDFPFEVPENTDRVDIRITWTVKTNDYDLRVLDPEGNQRTSSGNLPGLDEQAGVASPEAGTWTARVDRFATVADEVRAIFTIVTRTSPDPRPTALANGPYKFPIGSDQTFTGSASGGTAPLTVGWDTDEDGILEPGDTVTTSYGETHRIVTFKVTDAEGFERRQGTSLLVASPERLEAATTAVTVVAVNDSGINPYHIEFSAETYPDPDVLALTKDFTRHPSEYIPGYPVDSQAILMTRGQGYFPPEDEDLWSLRTDLNPNGLEFGRLYWIPGTKIVGAIQPGTFSCANCVAGAHVILDDDGHGSGSAAVSVGNRYGYCPTCVLVVVKGLSNGATTSAQIPWIDINSNSWGTLGNAPIGLTLQLGGFDPGRIHREAVERGQTVLFAAGNGFGNAFESIEPTYQTETTGPDWNIVVGAIRRDNERAILGEGTPVHLSAWGDGNLPAACRTGVVSQCAFSGTSAATPYTSGIFGSVLTAIRRHLGDNSVGQRPGQVVAEGLTAVGESPYLSDGKLTRGELREAVLKTSFPLNQDNAQTLPIFPYPLTAPYNGDINVLFEGYGAATPNGAKRAIDVLLGRQPLPIREAEDRFFALDRQIRDSLWGGYDRDGDGVKESEAPLGAFGLTEESVGTAEAIWETMRTVAALSMPEVPQTLGTNGLRYYLHREFSNEPDATPSCASNIQFMDQEDRAGDFEPCFDSRITSVIAAFRPLGIWPSTGDTTVPIPAGSSVFVELYMTVETPTAIQPTGVLMATDREIGEGAGIPQPVVGSGPLGAACATLGEACWTKFTWSFDTTRHAIAGEQLTFQVQLLGTRSWGFGYEGAHASRITIFAAPVPSELDFGATFVEPEDGATLPEGAASTASGFATFPDLGTTEAGDHPTVKRVYVSVDDPEFGSPIEATLALNADETAGSWSAPLPGLSGGTHTLYARACIDTNCSENAERTVVVEATASEPQVQWQVVPSGSAPSADGWSVARGVLEWAFELDTRDFGKGDFDIHVRLVEGGAVTAATSVSAKFR